MPRYQTLMPIRTKGSLPPLFCVHGQPLKVAQKIRSDRPVYGLSHVYHSDFMDESPDSMEELASLYLSEVRQVQPKGPYYFCGFSAGGLIAYEMARQLTEAGERIGNLLLVEPTVMNDSYKWSARALDSIAETHGFNQVLNLIFVRAPKSLVSRTRNFSRMMTAQFYLAIRKPLPESLRWLGYLKSLGPAMSKYEYKPVNCSGIVLYRNLSDEFRDSCREFWGHLMLEGVNVRTFANAERHEDFMIEPALSQTVELIDRLEA
jgi:pimeloyl-ACP methyl ester carboxylesterase